MGFLVWIFYIISGIFLTLFINLLRRRFSLTKFQSLIFSIIYLMFLAGFCARYDFTNFNENIFLVFVFSLVANIIYDGYVRDKDFFDKNDGNLSYFLTLIIIGYLINNELINKVKEVFLTGEDLKIIIWFILILFMFFFVKEKGIFKEDNVYLKKNIPSNERIMVSYAKLKNKYFEDVNYKDKDLCLLIYTIMIYENYNRPNFFRLFDNFMFRFDGKERKFGIMQVKSKKFISDLESIEIVYKKLEKLSEKSTVSKKNRIIDIIKLYDKEKADDLINIYTNISRF